MLGIARGLKDREHRGLGNMPAPAVSIRPYLRDASLAGKILQRVRQCEPAMDL